MRALPNLKLETAHAHDCLNPPAGSITLVE